MATTKVSHVTVTVSTVDVFINTMRFIHENDLWGEVQAYLKENDKTEMFVDFDAFYLLRKMLEQDSRFDPEHPVVKVVLSHNIPHYGNLEPSS